MYSQVDAARLVLERGVDKTWQNVEIIYLFWCFLPKSVASEGVQRAVTEICKARRMISLTVAGAERYERWLMAASRVISVKNVHFRGEKKNLNVVKLEAHLVRWNINWI